MVNCIFVFQSICFKINIYFRILIVMLENSVGLITYVLCILGIFALFSPNSAVKLTRFVVLG